MQTQLLRYILVAGTALAATCGPADAASITFDWSIDGGTFVEPQPEGAYTLSIEINANAGTLTLDEGESATVQLQGFTWSVDASAEGAVQTPVDRMMTIDGADRMVDQDFRLSVGPFNSMFSGHPKKGTFHESSPLTYNFGPRGMVDVTLVTVETPPGLGTLGTSAYGTTAQGTGIAARFTAHDIVPEPTSLALLAIGGLAIIRRR